MNFEIVLIASFVSIACAIPGVFLVLRRMSLMSDAISHAVLPGIVIGFLVTHNLSQWVQEKGIELPVFLEKLLLTDSLASPLLVLGAVIMGIITVVLTEGIAKTGLVKNDAAIGIVFPALFSAGVILVSLLAGNVHLDTDAVLLGELVFAPFDRIELFGMDFGPRSAWTMGGIAILNVMLLLLFFKELKISTFDPGLSAALGLFPALIHYGLMIDVSITAVGAFNSVGSILVVALMIAPAAAAYLLTDNLKLMILMACVIGILSAISGFGVALALNANIAGAMAGMAGIFFLGAFLLAPHRGMISIWRKRRQQKIDFGISMLAVHILHHRHNADAAHECHRDHLQEHINWDVRFARAVVTQAEKLNLIIPHQGILSLTAEGESRAQEAMGN